MKTTLCLALLLAASPAALRAQTTTDSLRQRGEVVGSRPSNRTQPTPPATTGRRIKANTNLLAQRLLGETVNLTNVRADEMPDLYERFTEVMRAERKQWKPADWNTAADVMSGLNERYEVVRTELSIEQRLRIRTLQGEFQTMWGARKVKDKIEESPL